MFDAQGNYVGGLVATRKARSTSLWVPGVFGLLVFGALLLGPFVTARARRLVTRNGDEL